MSIVNTLLLESNRQIKINFAGGDLVVYAIKKPQLLLLDLDSTLLNTYGHQEGEGFNFHYRKHGYHPLVCYDGMTGDLLKSNSAMVPTIPSQELWNSYSHLWMNF